MDKERKKYFGRKIKDEAQGHGIGEMFRMIEDGANESQVEAFIAEKVAQWRAEQPEPVECGEISPYAVFGASIIAESAIRDMEAIMSLPYAIEGALMPDAHRVVENGVPVGGVVVTTHPVPAIVGNDIACSVRFTETDQLYNDSRRKSYVDALKQSTRFGYEQTLDQDAGRQWLAQHSPVFVTEFATDLWQRLKNHIVMQFGTSGSGNHFVEIGEYNGKLAIASHFGSRKFGGVVASAYQKKALQQFAMPKGFSAAPLTGDDAADYWTLMQLAGDYAKSGHEYVHQRICDALGATEVNTVYNRHNFAWQVDDGIYIHRKGATPASAGQLGFIPATMAHPSALVVGKGDVHSWSSASHGAGRRMSRGQAKRALRKKLRDGETEQAFIEREYGVTLIGAGLDEFPDAYKSLNEVMAEQSECVDVVGWFTPHVVRMADPERRR